MLDSELKVGKGGIRSRSHHETLMHRVEVCGSALCVVGQPSSLWLALVIGLQVNHAEPVPNQLLRSGDQVEIVSISKLDQLPGMATSYDQQAAQPGRSTLVRRVGRPPRPSSEIVRSHDAIGRAEVEAKRVELIRAFQQPAHDGDVSKMAAGGDLEQDYTVPLIYSYGFVEGQPDLN